MTGRPALFGITGADAGTRHALIAALVRAAAARAIGVSALIETEAGFDIDRPGKDSFEHRRAGAREVVIASARRWAKMHERDRPPEARGSKAGSDADRAAAEARLRQAVAAMSPADLVLVEGFEAAGHPRLRIAGDRARSQGPDGGGAAAGFALADLEGMLAFITRGCGITLPGRAARNCEPAEA